MKNTKLLILLSFIPILIPETNAIMSKPTTTTAAVHKTLKLYYADIPFWRAECVRMAFFLGDIDFEDSRVSRDQSQKMKSEGKLPFGALPVLEVDENKMLSQTQAIAVYAAKLAGIQPEDPWLCAKIDECISGCTDVTETIGKTFSIKDVQEKTAARQVLLEKEGGRLYMHLNGLAQICAENGCEEGYSVGTSLTVADLAIWRLVGWVDSGTIDGIPIDFTKDKFPALAKLIAAVDAVPKVQEWKAKHSKFYAPL